MADIETIVEAAKDDDYDGGKLYLISSSKAPLKRSKHFTEHRSTIVECKY